MFAGDWLVVDDDDDCVLVVFLSIMNLGVAYSDLVVRKIAQAGWGDGLRKDKGTSLEAVAKDFAGDN